MLVCMLFLLDGLVVRLAKDYSLVEIGLHQYTTLSL